ncbi:MAG TPA: hypothetical protein VEJ20_08315, partial [Candidatus Eremiobacteraceae bacterium]|nr:hypothetical protein [Candidatus Eremiobacteraceae bacterium]
SLFHSGGTGVAIFVLAIALGGLPFVMTPSKSTNLIAFGAACAAIGVLIGFRTFSYMGETIQADYGTGLYAGVLGFLVLAYGYGRKVIR